jgi:hemoglobin/transferrin/lactoferrin receptor protein
MKTNRKILSLAIAVALTSVVNAQETLEKTIVTGEATPTESAVMTVINADKIDAEMITDIYDTVRYIPGVNVNTTGNRFGDDGFNIRGLEGDAVAITVDGLSQGESLNPITFSRYGMYSSTRNSIEIESVKTVEILKGANSVIAGSGALGGAVMYTTKDADDYLTASGDDFGGSVKAGYDGRNEETLLNVGLAGRIGQLEGLVILTKRDASETKAHSNGENIEGPERGQADPYDSDKINVLAKLNYAFGDQHELGLVFENFDNESQGTPLSRQSASYYDFYTFDESNRERIGITYQWQGQSTLFDKVEAALNSQEIYTRGSTFFSFSSGGSSYLRNEDRNYTQNLTNFDIDFSKDLLLSEVKHSLVYGLAIEQTEVENELQDIRYNDLTTASGLRDGYPIVDPSWVPKTKSDILTFYVTDTVEISDELTFQGGLRYDKKSYSPEVSDSFIDQSGESVDDAEFNAMTWSANLRYEFLPKHSITGGISTGFKAPTTQQLYLNTNGTSEYEDTDRFEDPDTGSVSYQGNGRTETNLNTVTNPNLDAEEGINYELEYQYQGESGYVNVALFQSDYDDFIINLTQSRTFDEPITQGSLNWWLPQCTAAVIDDSCWTVEQITEDEWGVPINTGEVTISGYEIEAGWKLSEGLLATFSHSHSEGEYNNSVNGSVSTSGEGSFEKGDELESISPNMTIIGLNYLASNSNWGATVHATLHDGKDPQDSFSSVFYTESATVVDLSAFYDVTDNFVVRVGVTNLFDEEYSLWHAVRLVREGSGGFFGGVSGDGIKRFSEPGREVSASVSYTF